MLEKVFLNKILPTFIKLFCDRLKFVLILKLDMIYLFHDVLSLEVGYIREKKRLERRGGSYLFLPKLAGEGLTEPLSYDRG
jgi:hypothetical protein